LPPIPLYPPSPEGKGEVVLRGGFAPSFLFLPHKLRIYLPIMEGDKKEESKRGAASNIMGSFRGAPAPLFKNLPLPLVKGRG